MFNRPHDTMMEPITEGRVCESSHFCLAVEKSSAHNVCTAAKTAQVSCEDAASL